MFVIPIHWIFPPFRTQRKAESHFVCSTRPPYKNYKTHHRGSIKEQRNKKGEHHKRRITKTGSNTNYTSPKRKEFYNHHEISNQINKERTKEKKLTSAKRKDQEHRET